MSLEPDEIMACLDRARGGCQEAWRNLVEHYNHILYRVLERRLNPQLQARVGRSDALQEIWAGLFIKVLPDRTFSSPEEFLAFLYVMVEHQLSHLHRDHLDAAKRSRNAEVALPTDVPDRSPRPEQFAEAEDEWLRLLRAFPRRDRHVLILLRIGHTHAEAAQAAGVCERTVAHIVEQARAIGLPRRFSA